MPDSKRETEFPRLSRSHPLVARLRRLARSPAGREAERVVLLEGIHLAQAALESGTQILEALASPRLERDAAGRELMGRLRAAGIAPRAVTDAVLDALHDAASPQGILILAARPRHTVTLDAGARDHPRRLLLLACGVQDPGNAGALVRLAEAAGAAGFVAADGADPFGQKALRASAGSALRLPVARLEGAPALAAWLAQARDAGFAIVGAASRGGTPYRQADWPRRLVLALGAESSGLPEQASRALSLRVTIPIAPRVESLNVATAAGILLFEAADRLELL
jgi:TrmH family RNA methyltransferase